MGGADGAREERGAGQEPEKGPEVRWVGWGGAGRGPRRGVARAWVWAWAWAWAWVLGGSPEVDGTWKSWSLVVVVVVVMVVVVVVVKI